MKVANRLELACETRIERFADYPNIAMVSEGAYDADIGGKSNRGTALRFSLYRRRAARYYAILHVIALTDQRDRSAKY